jgi:hypothetical protein
VAKTQTHQPTQEQRERLENVADALAELLGVDPEDVMVEPSTLRVSLKLAQVESLVAKVNSH